MTQLVQPNLSTVGTAGLCEKYTEDVFGVSTARHDADAVLGWEQDGGQHPGETPPADIAVPIAFDWYGTIDGEYKNWGHRCVWVKGQVYSSPLSGTGHLVYGSIPAIKQAFGLGNYLGWSEYIEDLKVIEGEPMVTEQDINNLYPLLMGRAADAGALGYVGKSFHDFLYDLVQSDEYKNRVGEIPDLQAKVDQLTKANLDLTAKLQGQPAPAPAPADPNSVVVTKDGFWAAFKKFLGL